MTFTNNFPNFNMGNFMSGWNDWFLPANSYSFMSNWNISSLFDFTSFMPSFSDWNIFSKDFGQTTSSIPSNSIFNFQFFNNIWDNSFSTFNTSNWNYGFSSIGDTFSISNRNKSKFSFKNYNATAGERLARIALNNRGGSKGYCAAYVKKAIQEAGLGRYESGHAYQMIGILRANRHFKEVSPDDYDVNSLPAGCVIVFKKGSQNYSPKYGHVEITTGDGRGISDVTTNKLRKPDAIFIPV